MAEKEKKQETSSVRDMMLKYIQLEREGKLDMDGDTLPLPMSPEVLKRLKEKSKNTESK